MQPKLYKNLVVVLMVALRRAMFTKKKIVTKQNLLKCDIAVTRENNIL